MFGDPVVPLPEESTEALHARYVEALQALAARHDVPIEIVE